MAHACRRSRRHRLANAAINPGRRKRTNRGLLFVSAVATGLVGAIGGTIATIGVVAVDLIPAMNYVKRAFDTIDLNRP